MHYLPDSEIELGSISIYSNIHLFTVMVKLPGWILAFSLAKWLSMEHRERVRINSPPHNEVYFYF